MVIEAPVTAAHNKAHARRLQILDAACDCVRRSGFHGASMAEIATAAGLSVGQIYRYFENKEAIIAAIVAQDLAELREKFAQFERPGATRAQVALMGCADAIDRCYQSDRAALMIEVVAEAARNPRVGAIVREADAAERALCHEFLASICPPGTSDKELEARTEMLSLLFEGLVMRAVNNPDGDRAEIAKVFRRVMATLVWQDPSPPD